MNALNLIRLVQFLGMAALIGLRLAREEKELPRLYGTEYEQFKKQRPGL